MKLLLTFFLSGIYTLSVSQGVGIGTTTPHASTFLHVDVGSSNRGFLVTGTYTFPSSYPNLGAGSRMMFYPGKQAFRAGAVTGNHWDNSNIGSGSVAIGVNTIASNEYCFATGANTIASGFGSTALGYLTTASNTYSTAMGSGTTASGLYSTAMGYQTTASGIYSTAMGFRVSTNNHRGAFVIGDSDPTNEGVAMPGLQDLFVARFYNGYYLYTSGIATNIGVAINHNGNAWVSACDKNLKENFETVNGEDVLQKISKINFTSWNYKQQDPTIYRHYGIMAQDFYNAFGKDKYGTIGNDTTVNPVDMIGIDMAAIQALEKRTSALNAENKTLELRNKRLEGEVAELKTSLQKERETIAKRLQQLEAVVLRQSKQDQLAANQ